MAKKSGGDQEKEKMKLAKSLAYFSQTSNSRSQMQFGGGSGMKWKTRLTRSKTFTMSVCLVVKVSCSLSNSKISELEEKTSKEDDRWGCDEMSEKRDEQKVSEKGRLDVNMQRDIWILALQVQCSVSFKEKIESFQRNLHFLPSFSFRLIQTPKWMTLEETREKAEGRGLMQFETNEHLKSPESLLLLSLLHHKVSLDSQTLFSVSPSVCTYNF